MGFQLVIAEGKEAGREFVFDQTSVLIGRTAECDVILYDPGVSRKHARIFADGEDFFVEDVGSSNGTRVNGAQIKKHLLKDGDAIALGPVVFTFSQVALDDVPTEAVDVGAKPQETRVVSAAELKRSRNKGVVMAPENAGREELEQIGRRNTATVQAIKPRSSAPPRLELDLGPALDLDKQPSKPRTSGPRPAVQPPADDTAPPRPSRPRALARRDDDDDDGALTRDERSRGDTDEQPDGAALVRAERGRRDTDEQDDGDALAREPAPERPARRSNPAARVLAASDRARIRREAGGGLGNFLIWWAEANKRQRALVAGGASVVGALLLALVVFLVWPSGDVKKLKEPNELNSTGEPIEHSFGLGPGVTFERADQKTFDFEVKTPVQALVLLHYQCRDISQNEVLVSVNGQEVGWLPPDTLNANELAHELIVPAQAVNRNQSNIVTFDNVKNPPEADPWRIWNVWAEIAVLPETNAETLVRSAKDNLRKGDQKWEQRDIGASNRWDAYKSYREAWLMLEAVPETTPDRTTTSSLARSKMGEVGRDLDLTCNKLLLEARSFFNQKQYEQARYTLDHVTQFFPSKAHPCQFRAEQERADFEL